MNSPKSIYIASSQSHNLKMFILGFMSKQPGIQCMTHEMMDKQDFVNGCFEYYIQSAEIAILVCPTIPNCQDDPLFLREMHSMTLAAKSNFEEPRRVIAIVDADKPFVHYFSKIETLGFERGSSGSVMMNKFIEHIMKTGL